MPLPEDLFLDGGGTGDDWVIPSSLNLLHTPAEPHMRSHCLPQIACLVLAWWSFHFEQVLAGVSRGEQRPFFSLTRMLGEAHGQVLSLKPAEAVFLTQVSALCSGRHFCKLSLINLPPPSSSLNNLISA